MPLINLFRAALAALAAAQAAQSRLLVEILIAPTVFLQPILVQTFIVENTVLVLGPGATITVNNAPTLLNTPITATSLLIGTSTQTVIVPSSGVVLSPSATRTSFQTPVSSLSPTSTFIAPTSFFPTQSGFSGDSSIFLTSSPFGTSIVPSENVLPQSTNNLQSLSTSAYVPSASATPISPAASEQSSLVFPTTSHSNSLSIEFPLSDSTSFEQQSSLPFTPSLSQSPSQYVSSDFFGTNPFNTDSTTSETFSGFSVTLSSYYVASSSAQYIGTSAPTELSSSDTFYTPSDSTPAESALGRTTTYSPGFSTVSFSILGSTPTIPLPESIPTVSSSDTESRTFISLPGTESVNTGSSQPTDTLTALYTVSPSSTSFPFVESSQLPTEPTGPLSGAETSSDVYSEPSTSLSSIPTINSGTTESSYYGFQSEFSVSLSSTGSAETVLLPPSDSSSEILGTYSTPGPLPTQLSTFVTSTILSISEGPSTVQTDTTLIQSAESSLAVSDYISSSSERSASILSITTLLEPSSSSLPNQPDFSNFPAGPTAVSAPATSGEPPTSPSKPSSLEQGSTTISGVDTFIGSAVSELTSNISESSEMYSTSYDSTGYQSTLGTPTSPAQSTPSFTQQPEFTSSTAQSPFAPSSASAREPSTTSFITLVESFSLSSSLPYVEPTYPTESTALFGTTESTVLFGATGSVSQSVLEEPITSEIASSSGAPSVPFPPSEASFMTTQSSSLIISPSSSSEFANTLATDLFTEVRSSTEAASASPETSSEYSTTQEPATPETPTYAESTIEPSIPFGSLIFTSSQSFSLQSAGESNFQASSTNVETASALSLSSLEPFFPVSTSTNLIFTVPIEVSSTASSYTQYLNTSPSVEPIPQSSLEESTSTAFASDSSPVFTVASTSLYESLPNPETTPTFDFTDNFFSVPVGPPSSETSSTTLEYTNVYSSSTTPVVGPTNSYEEPITSQPLSLSYDSTLSLSPSSALPSFESPSSPNLEPSSIPGFELSSIPSFESSSIFSEYPYSETPLSGSITETSSFSEALGISGTFTAFITLNPPFTLTSDFPNVEPSSTPPAYTYGDSVLSSAEISTYLPLPSDTFESVINPATDILETSLISPTVGETPTASTFVTSILYFSSIDLVSSAEYASQESFEESPSTAYQTAMASLTTEYSYSLSGTPTQSTYPESSLEFVPSTFLETASTALEEFSSLQISSDTTLPTEKSSVFEFTPTYPTSTFVLPPGFSSAESSVEPILSTYQEYSSGFTTASFPYVSDYTTTLLAYSSEYSTISEPVSDFTLPFESPSIAEDSTLSLPPEQSTQVPTIITSDFEFSTQAASPTEGSSSIASDVSQQPDSLISSTIFPDFTSAETVIVTDTSTPPDIFSSLSIFPSSIVPTSTYPLASVGLTSPSGVSLPTDVIFPTDVSTSTNLPLSIGISASLGLPISLDISSFTAGLSLPGSFILTNSFTSADSFPPVDSLTIIDSFAFTNTLPSVDLATSTDFFTPTNILTSVDIFNPTEIFNPTNSFNPTGIFSPTDVSIPTAISISTGVSFPTDIFTSPGAFNPTDAFSLPGVLPGTDILPSTPIFTPTDFAAPTDTFTPTDLYLPPVTTDISSPLGPPFPTDEASFTDTEPDTTTETAPNPTDTCFDPANGQTFNLVTDNGDIMVLSGDQLRPRADLPLPPETFHFEPNFYGFPYLDSFDLVLDGDEPQYVALRSDGTFVLLPYSTGPFQLDIGDDYAATTSVFNPDCVGYVYVYTSPTQIDLYEDPVPWVMSGDSLGLLVNSPLSIQIRVSL